MGDVYREGTPEKNWIESLRKGPHQGLVKDRTSPLGDGKVRRGQLQQHCDSVIVYFITSMCGLDNLASSARIKTPKIAKYFFRILANLVTL